MLQVKQEPKSPYIPYSQNPITKRETNALSLERDLHEGFKQWIRSGSLLREIGEKCQKFRETVEEQMLETGFDCERISGSHKMEEEQVIFEFTLPINIMDLIEFNALIGEVAIKETKLFLDILQKAMFEIIQENEWLGLSKETQLSILPEISNLPAFSEHSIPSMDGKLIKLRGSVVSVTPILQYTKGVKYNCPEEECPCFTGKDNILVWLPGISESALVRSDYTCSRCCSYLQEDVTHRVLREKRIVKLILNDGLDCLQANSSEKFARHQAFTVILRDDQVDQVDFGMNYWITGVITRDFISVGQCQQAVHVMLEAFNVEKIHESIMAKHIIEEEVPNSIRNIYADRASSPWSFVASLAYCFAESITVNGSYNRLKTTLLYSLVMLGDNVLIEDINGKLLIGKDLANVHIFAAAEDIIIVQRLLSYAAMFSQRCCPTQSGVGMFGDVTKHSNDGRYFIDGGSLLLSGRHVCTIPNISAMKKDEVEKLQKVLETNTVVFNTPKKVADQTEFMQLSFPLQSTVWAAADSTSLEKSGSVKWRPLLENFDLVYNFTGEHDVSDDIAEDNAQQLLRRSMGIEKQPEINYEDFLKFIKFARFQRVNFSESASNILKAFFLASRRARGTGINGVEISPRSLQTLLSLAAAHAKLSLRKEVLVEDALMSILLYEESITMRYGYSVIEVIPRLHFSRKNLTAHLGPKNDEFMRRFHFQVLHFCKTYSTGISSGFFRKEE